jgi:hypothetical protein
MNIKHAIGRTRQEGWALLVVLSLCATGLLLVASIIGWANENAEVTTRNSEFFTTTYAAEAATEKALSAIVQDDQNYGEGLVLSKSAGTSYSSLVPTASDNSYWTNFQFSSGLNVNQILVKCLSTTTTNVLGPPYSGLLSVGSTYQIIANAQNLYSSYHINATVGQQVVLGQIPIFQFAIFYNDTMEVDPGATMNVNGMVHGNTNIYLDPSGALTFSNDVSATGTLNLSENPLDPTSRGAPTISFNGSHVADVNPLNLPVGTNTSGISTNVGASVNAILQVPPAGESPTSATGTNRLYNQADMIISISNGNIITVTSGVDVNNKATVISNNQWASFISTNGSFYNMRDGNTVDPVDIDVGALRAWSATNTVLRPLLSSLRGSSQSDVQSIYVVDQRFLSNTVIITNYSYTTNTATTNTSGYPASGTFYPPVTSNTIVSTGSSLPTSGQYIPPILSTNTTSTTTTNAPSAGTYLGSITTNTTVTTTGTLPGSGTYLGSISSNATVTTSSTLPAPGTYLGTITTNGSGSGKTYTYNKISGYTYNLDTGYTYSLITGYIYNGITGYTYTAIVGVTTNISYTTNYIQFAEEGIVLTNGATLPATGLSVVSPDPVYVVGNWNVSTNGTTMVTQSYNTTSTLPSAIYADAVTILSPAWNPANSTASLTGSSRNATADTVNAAILTGIVPSNGTYYSGGVENFPRFQENWSGVNFYYNGSMVEMFTSQIANYPWPGTGTVYNPPNRYWAFDTNFNNPSQLPPLTPKVIYLNRARWASIPPGSTQF